MSDSVRQKYNWAPGAAIFTNCLPSRCKAASANGPIIGHAAIDHVVVTASVFADISLGYCNKRLSFP